MLAAHTGPEDVAAHIVMGKTTPIPEINEVLAGMIDLLPKKDRILLSLIWVEECTIKEAALILGQPETTINRQLTILNERITTQAKLLSKCCA